MNAKMLWARKINLGIAFCIVFFNVQTLLAQEQRVNISKKALPVKEILKELEQKAGLSFMYSGLEEELSQKISLSATAGTVPDILRQISHQSDLGFNYSGNIVSIKKIKAEKGTIRGTVVSELKLPVPGATVSLTSKKSTITDEQGGFSFNDIEVGKYILQVTHITYTSKRQPVVVQANSVTKIQCTLDTLHENHNTLNPVVVTGQYRPQSLNKSIYRVEVIDKMQIQNMAVSTVAELLKQQLNIEIENQSGTGRAKIRVLGLNSQYVKILMDNIPVAGDENMGSDVDLNTISLDDVERVEIVKGAMGVEYGANSIGGVINIITKKTAKNKTDLSIEIQEETVRDEYNIYFDERAKGRHIQKINASHKLTANLAVGGSVSRDEFNGYWGGYQGAGTISNLMEIGTNTQKRGYEWSPKISWNGNAYISRTGKSLNLFYKFNYFRSDLTNYDHLAGAFFLRDEQLFVNASTNNDYRNHRYNHHLNLRGDFWKNAYYTLDVSFQKNGLEHRRQAINLHDNSVLNKANGIPGSDRLQATDWEKHYQSKGFYAKGTLLKPVVIDKLDYNIGFELDNTTGNQGYTNWFNDVSLSSPIERTLFNGAIYTSAEWQATSKIMIRPGFRINHNNKFNLRTNESVTTRFKINNHNDIRLIIGTSTRFPNYQELYSWFVDAVHDYRGNPDLRPEYGKSVELQWAHRRTFDGNLQLQTSVSSMFQHIRDRIVSVVYRVPGDNRLTGRNTYANENKYNGLLNQLNLNLVSDRFNMAIAGSVLAYRGDDDATVNNYDKFLTNIQGSAQLTYLLPWALRVSMFYRYVGREPLYTFIPQGVGYDLQPTGFIKVLNKTDAYHNMDFNIARSLLKQKIEVRLGVRDLFDVRDIKYKPVNKPDAVPDSAVQGVRILRLYYGRSYFVKITYNIFN